MLKFLPKNFDLDRLLEAHPPDFTYHKDHFIHLCSLLFELPAKKKDVLLKSGCVALNSFLLKKVNNKYKRYFDYLIKHGVIECNNSYVPGKRSKGYRFASKYQDIIRPVRIEKYTLTKNLKEVHRFNRDMFAKYDYLYKWFDNRLKIDYNGAEQKLIELFNAEKGANWDTAMARLNANLVNLIKFREKDFSFTVDSTSHRLHTLFTKLKKELRHFVSYDGIPLVNIDLRCSQPTLSLCLLSPDFYCTETSLGAARINRIDPALCEVLPIQKIASYVGAHQKEFESYRQMVKSDLYALMAERLKAHNVDIADDRKAVKKIIFLALYSSNRFFNADAALPKRIFKGMFPEVYEVLFLFKTAQAERLPILLQKIESQLILDRVAKTISKKHPDMPLFTIHDSIVCPLNKEEECKRIIESETRTFLGFAPVLQSEPWLQEKQPASQSLLSLGLP
jgi:hypothetical protein